MSAWTVRLGGSDASSDHADAPVRHATKEFAIEDSLGYLLNRAARLMAHRLADRLRAHGVGIGQWAVLMFLWARDGISQAELSRLVAIEPPTMVRTIDRMVRDGLVLRGPDPTDGRAGRIHLTDRGWSLRDALLPEAVAVNRAAAESMTESEAGTLRRLLGKLLAGGENED